MADPTQGLNFYIHSVFTVKFKQPCVAAAMVLDSSDGDTIPTKEEGSRRQAAAGFPRGMGDRGPGPVYRRSPQRAVVMELPELQALWGPRAEQSHWMMRLALYFLTTLAGRGRVTQPECLKTITIGITVKVSDLRSRAQLGAQQDSEGRQ